MLKKIFKFFSGYVIIEATGKKCGHFANALALNGIPLTDILPAENGIKMTLPARDFRKIRRLARKTGVRVRRTATGGFGAWRKRNGLRLGFFVSAAAVCAAMMVLSRHICIVEIDGAEKSNREEISAILREHGVYAGAAKSGIGDLTELKNDIVYTMPNISWAWLYIDGVKATLKIAETDSPPQIKDKNTPTDIIARCDGYVTKAVVKRGERRVIAGDAVSKGDVLVSGTVAVFREGMEEKYITVHSDAKIIAETVHHASGTFSDTETLTVRTGRVRRHISLEIFGHRFDLYRDKSAGFETFENTVRGKRFPFVTVIVKTFYETRQTERTLTEDEVLTRARETLEERVCAELGTGARLLDSRLVHTVSGGVYRVELRMRFTENIGMEIPTEE